MDQVFQCEGAWDGNLENLWRAVKSGQPPAVAAAVFERHFNEEMAVFVAKSKRTPQETLAALAGDIRFKNSYRLKVALCRNPKTPQKASMSLLKFLKIFELVDISKDQLIGIAVRQKIEHMLSERIPSLPEGVKSALAKRAGRGTLLFLMEHGNERVISASLENSALTEMQIYKLINRTATKREIIRLISSHPKWALRYSVRFALVRNFHTPMTCAVKFISALNTPDLRELYSDSKIPSSTRPFIYRELLDRGECPDAPEEIFECRGDEDGAIFPDGTTDPTF